MAISQPSRHATLDLATGEITRDSQDKAAGLVTIWANTDWSGFYSLPFLPGEEWLDWGAISTTSGSDIIGAFTFGYATTVLDTTIGGPGTRLCTNFYDDAVGWCAESGLGLLPDASYCFSGLPGTTSTGSAAPWVITVDLVGGMEGTQDAGDFAFTLSVFDTVTGPLMCYAGTTGGGAYDGNGVRDLAVGATNDDDGARESGAVWILRLGPGELLIDVGSGWLFSDFAGGVAGVSHHAVPIPNDPTLIGATASTQGFLLYVAGASLLTNALDLTIGF